MASLCSACLRMTPSDGAWHQQPGCRQRHSVAHQSGVPMHITTDESASRKCSVCTAAHACSSPGLGAATAPHSGTS